MMKAVTDETFKAEVLDSELPVLVDFWAEWCAPCHRLAPVLDELSEEYAGRARIVKLDSDENPEATREYGVMSMPTLVMFRGGEVVSQVIGAHPKGKLRELIDGAL
jgi:thioredoxin 1